MASLQEEAKLERFLQWLQVNGVELRGCNIKYSDSDKGFGIFAADEVSDGVLLVVPLDLAITPMRVLQDPLFGPECRAMFEEGDVDDRLLMVLFLTVERLRKNSSWKPYLDMLPTTFGNPLWFTDDELLELKGTTLYRATELQKKSLQSLYDDKLKVLVEKLLTLDGFGGASKTGCDQASTEQKVEPLKPTLKIRIKLVQRPKDDKLNKPCLDKATLSKPCLDEAKLIKPPCVDEDKLIKPKPKPNPCLDEVAIEAKLQATKRKLHNQYQEIDNIKRQRRIQVLKDLPKQDFKLGCPTSTKPQGKKLGNHNLHSTERRRVSNKLGFQGLQCSRVVSATH
ncbi:hypothetical protein M0R45_034573 [Rubus argutus]|uniref:SET domain-containing protein n=1 Tax=Rubus argutus TaxID=59490 RepID=A0AAW1VU81_RUBAR